MGVFSSLGSPACREQGRWAEAARVRDAATHVESGREEVGHRDPHRGVEPRCLAEARGR